MTGIVNGQPVDQTASNASWIAKNGDDATVGIIALQKVDVPGSGGFITNVQAELNADCTYTGRPVNSGPSTAPLYTNNEGFTPGETLKNRADAITAKFHHTSGHAHTGSTGDGPPVAASSLSSVPLAGYIIQGASLTSVSGSTYDLSTNFLGFVASTGPTSEGVVVTFPNNKCLLRQYTGPNQGDQFEDGSGNVVYGRITNSGITWTLSFYVMISSTETVYSFPTPVNIDFYYQRLYNPMLNPPVYSFFASIPSDNVTSDVIDATTTQKGKVQLSTVSADVSTTSSAGTANATVANADHSHQGVHAIFKTGDTTRVGDIEIDASGGITITRSGNKFTFNSSSGTSLKFEVLAGTVDGINATFGPLSHVPIGSDSILVLLDGVGQAAASWTLDMSNNIVFGTAPSINQTPEVYYAYSGVVLGTSALPKTEFRTLSSIEAAAKSLTLAQTPSIPGEILVDAIGGGAQEWSVDYTVSGAVLSWSGLGLDGILATGDKLRVFYHYTA